MILLGLPVNPVEGCTELGPGQALSSPRVASLRSFSLSLRNWCGAASFALGGLPAWAQALSGANDELRCCRGSEVLNVGRIIPQQK